MQRNTFRIIIAHLIAIIFGKVLWSIPRISKYYKFGLKYSCWWFLLLFQQTVNSNLLSITSKPTNTNLLHEIFISDRLLSISAEHVAFWCGNRPIKYAVFFCFWHFPICSILYKHWSECVCVGLHPFEQKQRAGGLSVVLLQQPMKLW